VFTLNVDYYQMKYNSGYHTSFNFMQPWFCPHQWKFNFTASAINLTMWLANLGLQVRVHTRLLTSIYHAMLFSALKIIFLWHWYCSKNKSNVVVVPWGSTTFWLSTVMTNNLVDKSTGNTKPHSICLIYEVG